MPALSAIEALSRILDRVRPGETEAVPLSEALGRVLREPVLADADSPAFDKSAMDGYAVIDGDSSESFRLIGAVEPGTAPAFRIEPGTCARIFTGAALPEGATRVVIQEEATVEGDRVRFQTREGPTHVRPRGQEYQKGATLVAAGERLGPVSLALLATAGTDRPTVARKPGVLHFATGNELVDPSAAPGPAEIRDSNSILVAALVAGAGGRIVAQERIRDDEERLHAAVAAGLASGGADFLLLSGGASVGEHDFSRRVLERNGFTVHFDRLHIRPGKPLIFATRGEQVAFAIPGNPLSHYVTFQLFIRRAVEARLAAAPAVVRFTGQLEGRLGEAVPGGDGRETYAPCRWRIEAGTVRVRALGWTSSNHLASLGEANGMLRIASLSQLNDGDEVEVLVWP